MANFSYKRHIINVRRSDIGILVCWEMENQLLISNFFGTVDGRKYEEKNILFYRSQHVVIRH